MTVITEARQAFDEIMHEMGTTCTLSTLNTPITYNSNGDEVKTYTDTTTSVLTEPYEEDSNEFGGVGRHVEGYSRMYFRYDITLNVGDTVTINSDVYRIETIRRGDAGGVAYIETVSKMQE